MVDQIKKENKKRLKIIFQNYILNCPTHCNKQLSSESKN